MGENNNKVPRHSTNYKPLGESCYFIFLDPHRETREYNPHAFVPQKKWSTGLLYRIFFGGQTPQC